MSLARRLLSRRSVLRTSSFGSSFVAPAGLAAAVALAFAIAPPSARAGDPIAAPPQQSPPQSPEQSPQQATPAVPPRQAALDAVIHRLERHLAFLRKSRTELESGRPEPVPADDVARRRAEVDQRGVRDVSRYEAARVKVVAALREAEVAKDATKIGDAKSALDTLDSKFVDNMKQLEQSLDAPPKSPQNTAPKAGNQPGARESAPKSAPKKSTKPAGSSSMSEGDSADDDEGDDDVAEDDFAADDTADDTAN